MPSADELRPSIEGEDPDVPVDEAPWLLAARRPDGTIAVADLRDEFLMVIEADRPPHPVIGLPDIAVVPAGFVYLNGPAAYLEPVDRSARIELGPADAVIGGADGGIWLVRRTDRGVELELSGPGVDARIVGVPPTTRIVAVPGLGPALVSETQSRLGAADGKLTDVSGRVLIGTPDFLLIERCPAAFYCAAVMLDRLDDGEAPVAAFARSDRLAALDPSGRTVVELPTALGDGAVMVDLASGNRTQLPNTPGLAHRFRWSPDGRYLFWAYAGVMYAFDSHTHDIHELGLFGAANSYGTLEVLPVGSLVCCSDWGGTTVGAG